MSSSKPNIVVLSTLFPSANEPLAGIFIRERMFRVASRTPVTVLAPRAWFPFQSVLRKWKPHFRREAQAHEYQQDVEIFRPRFLSVPGILKRWDGLFLAIACLGTLRRLKRAGRLDVLDAHFAYPDGYAAGLLGRWLRVPVTVTLRGSEARHASDPVLRKYVQVALQRADLLFAVSESLKRVALALGASQDGVRVIGNGVDTAKFHLVSKTTARAQLKLPDEAPVLISVGGLVERKGIHRVFDCLPELRKRHPGLQYLVVGGPTREGDWSARLRARVAELRLQDCVRFLGPLASEHVNVALSAADVFVLATRNEGWANVFLEAMACGLPVVTTDVGGNAEVVSRASLGTIVPFGDPTALSNALDDALTKVWNHEEIVKYARENSWDSRVSALLEAFRMLAHGPARGNRIWREETS